MVKRVREEVTDNSLQTAAAAQGLRVLHRQSASKIYIPNMGIFLHFASLLFACFRISVFKDPFQQREIIFPCTRTARSSG